MTGVLGAFKTVIITVQSHGVLGAAPFYDDWQGVVYWFAGLSVMSVVLLRIVFQRVKTESPDITDY